MNLECYVAQRWKWLQFEYKIQYWKELNEISMRMISLSCLSLGAFTMFDVRGEPLSESSFIFYFLVKIFMHIHGNLKIQMIEKHLLKMTPWNKNVWWWTVWKWSIQNRNVFYAERVQFSNDKIIRTIKRNDVMLLLNKN